MIFRRLQGGTENLEPGPLPYDKIPHGFKTRAGIYDPGGAPTPEQEHDDQQTQADEDDLWEQTLQRRRETAYKTIGVKINGEEVEIPIWDENMTPEQAEGFARDRLEMGLSPFASDMELETAQNNNAKRQGHAMGTSSVNQGLYFYRKQLKKPRKNQK